MAMRMAMVMVIMLLLLLLLPSQTPIHKDADHNAGERESKKRKCVVALPQLDCGVCEDPRFPSGKWAGCKMHTTSPH